MSIKRIIIALLLLTPFANAANWFVLKGAGGSNNGTSWTNAWTELSSINFGSVACGDTIWLGGGTYTSTMTVAKTCTSGAILTIQSVESGDTVPTTAPGYTTAVLNQVILGSNNGFNIDPASFITISGRHGTIGTEGTFGIVIQCTNNCNAVTFGTSTTHTENNNTLTYIELFGPPCVTSGGSGEGSCTGDTHAVDHGQDIENNLLLDHMWMHRWAEIVRPYQWTNYMIQYSDLDTTRQTPDEHEDIMYAANPTSGTMRYNQIWGSPNDGIFFDFGGNALTFYGNVYYNSGGALITFKSGFTNGAVVMYNNTFNSDETFGDFKCPSNCPWIDWTGTPSSAIVQDNIFDHVTYDGSPSSSNWNAFSSDIGKQDSGANSFTYTSSFTSNTQFISINTSNPIASNFQLTSTGQTTFATGLAQSAPYNVDPLGVARGNATGWTIGAFQTPGTTTVATPVPSPAAGTYIGYQTVSLSVATAGATICYTTDGSTPTATTPGTCSHGITYSAPFLVDSSKSVLAIGTLSGDANSSLLNAAYVINHQSWFVRADGGTIFQCTGKVDAAYPGSGSNQACGVNDMRWLYDNQTNNDWQANGSSWIVGRGDTVILESAAAIAAVSGKIAASPTPTNRIGWDYGGSCSGAGCGAGFTWCNGVGQCGVPPLPAGTPASPTHFWGQNHGACSTTTTFPGALVATTIPDPTKMFEFYGDFGLNTTMDLSGTHDVDIQCVHITTHGDCIIHISPNTTIPCSTSIPLSSYSSEGVRSSTTTGTVSMTDVWISGFQDSGWFGPIDGAVTMNDVRMSYNVQTGFNMDNGTDPQSGGTVTTNRLTLDFNGCNQKWPFVTTVPIDYCSDQSSAGDGDGVATPGSSSDTFINDHTTAVYNTQDGFDIGHNQDPGSASWNHSVMYGNMAGTFKSGGESASVINSTSITNCYRMAAPITGVPNTFNSVLTLFCRANGDGVGLNWLGGASGEVLKLQDDTIVTYGGVAVDAQVQGSGSCTGCTFLTQGNVFLAYNNPSTGAPHNPGMYNLTSPGFGPTTTDHNTIFNFFGYTCTGSDQCVDPLFVSEPPPATPVGNSGLDSFNFNLTSGSPAVASQIPIAGITDDFFGVTRLNPTSAGAAQFVTSGAVATPSASPVAGTYTSAQSVTLSTVTAGAVICYTVDGTTPTATTPGTCSHGATYSTPIPVSVTTTILAIGTLTGDTNSAVGSFVYTINLPTVATPTAAPGAGTYTIAQNVVLSTATGGATICYTVDGSTPTASSGSCTHGAVYSSAIPVTGSLTIQAIGTLSGSNNSSVGSFAYVITTHSTTFNGSAVFSNKVVMN